MSAGRAAVCVAGALALGALVGSGMTCSPCEDLPPFPTGDYAVVSAPEEWQLPLEVHLQQAEPFGTVRIEYVDSDGSSWTVEY
jgi:hypothetical protein